MESTEELLPLAVAKLLKALVDKAQPGMIILGRQAIDDDCNQTGQMLAALAALAGLPQATFASKVALAERRWMGWPPCQHPPPAPGWAARSPRTTGPN